LDYGALQKTERMSSERTERPKKKRRRKVTDSSQQKKRLEEIISVRLKDLTRCTRATKHGFRKGKANGKNLKTKGRLKGTLEERE